MDIKTQAELESFVERIMEDFPFYAENMLKIQDKAANTITFKLNRCQLRVWKIIKECIDNKKPIRIIILKARQLGISTFIQALFFWFVTMDKNKMALVVAHDQEAAENLLQKQKFFYNHLPDDFFKPKRKISNRKELHFASEGDKEGLESRVLVNTAEKANLGRSFTFQALHLSEFGFWEDLGYNPKKRLGAVMQALVDLVWTFLMIETTANGEGYFKELWEDDDSVFTRIFISWIADDTYRLEILDDEDYFELSDDFENIYGNELIEAKFIAEQIRFWYEGINEDDLFIEIYARLNWRRHTILTKCQKDWRVFQQEYPTIPEQAFIASGSNVFNQQALSIMSREAMSPRYLTFDFDGIRAEFEEKKSQLEVTQKICLEFFEESQIKRSIELFSVPMAKRKYVIGCDVAEGIKGADHSSIFVLDVKDLQEVFSYDGVIDPVSFAYLVFAVGRIYNDALVAIEINDKGGATALNVLQRILMYPNLYFREDKNTTRYYKREQKYGWKTTKYTKQLLIGSAYTLIDQEEITFHNQELIKQFKLFRLFDDGKTGVAPPNHDDLCIAAMIAIQVMNEVLILDEPETKKTRFSLTIDDLMQGWEQKQNLVSGRINREYYL